MVINYSVYYENKKDLDLVISRNGYQEGKTEKEINTNIEKVSKSCELGSFNVILQKKSKADI